MIALIICISLYIVYCPYLLCLFRWRAFKLLRSISSRRRSLSCGSVHGESSALGDANDDGKILGESLSCDDDDDDDDEARGHQRYTFPGFVVVVCSRRECQEYGNNAA
jgi:hypothetical protein